MTFPADDQLPLGPEFHYAEQASRLRALLNQAIARNGVSHAELEHDTGIDEKQIGRCRPGGRGRPPSARPRCLRARQGQAGDLHRGSRVDARVRGAAEGRSLGADPETRSPGGPAPRHAGGTVTTALTVGEWLARRRAIEERRARIYHALEEGGGRPPLRSDWPCPLRVMTEAERTQRPRAFTVSPSAPSFVTALRGDPYRAKKLRRDE